MFAAGRGHQKDGVDVPSLEMVKWFDTNYHYMRPEVSSKTEFKLNLNESNVNPVSMFQEAKAVGIVTRPVLLGPVTFLHLSKVSKCSETNGNVNGDSSLEPIDLISKLVPVYAELINKLAAEGAEWIQVDEPILVFDLEPKVLSRYQPVYEQLRSLIAPSVKLLLTTYFGEIPDENMAVVSNLQVDGVHFDLVRGADQLTQIVNYSKKTKKTVSLGIVDGRNVWKNDLNKSLELVHNLYPQISSGSEIIISSSSSLLHVPHCLTGEDSLDPVIKSWFSFAVEKITELVTLTRGMNKGSAVIAKELEENSAVIKSRKESKVTLNETVRKRMGSITESDLNRKEPFTVRREKQMEWMKLPLFPTTTIGSFPQTAEIRAARAKFTKGEMTPEHYKSFIEGQIKEVIEFQEKVGLDVLVHGEAERNDMVQYFGERMDGFVFTLNGWVQSYGSRCVRPPIVVGDVSRPKAMTVNESAYAQSITRKPVKGMLTGPVTIIRWSFPRDDVSQDVQLKQVALAIRDEVSDLEKAGIRVIQVDEPAVREGLPLRKKDWSEYLKSAVTSFKLATSGVKSDTQIHSHFCYSDFNDIFDSIQALDADVISIEASKSDLKLIQGFKKFGYKAWIGPGVYDIHSPRVPSLEEVIGRVQSVLTVLPTELVWINPDCGLKTRAWKETKASLENLVAAAKYFRGKYSK